MKNITSYTWCCLPFVFSSAVVLTTNVSAAPNVSQQYQDAQQVNRVQQQFVGGRTQLGVGVSDEGNVDAQINQVISDSNNHSTSVGIWADFDVIGDNKGLDGRGIQVNHNWVSRNQSGEAKHVNKVFAAYDKNEAGHDKATVGYGRENQDVFWEGHVSKGLSGNKNSRSVGSDTVSDRAYDYGVGASVGKYLENSNLRVRAGLDHEWSDKVANNESDATNTTLSAGVEKFFFGTPHSVSVDVAASKSDGGYGPSDNDVSGRLGYRYDFGGSVYQADSTTRRVRVEIPGQNTPPITVVKTQYKKVPTYKTVPVFENKIVTKTSKQLVKSTMALEGQTFFKLNSHKLVASAQSRLKQVAHEIRKSGYKGSIRITGNTCGMGSADYDQRLSERRAREVRNFLIKNGFNPDHLIARGLGKAHPKFPNTPEHGFKNRRVDIEYVAEQNHYKDVQTKETKRVQTGTRKVATGFKNVPVGTKNIMIDSGKKGSPRVVWKTETIKNAPAWISRALNNNIKHDRTMNTFQTTQGGTSSPINSSPIAVDDAATASCNAPISINVLANDNDADGDTLTVTHYTQPQFGSVSQSTNGQFIYTSNGTDCGRDDRFSYTVSDDNGNSSTADVVITVAADDVVVAANETITTNVGESITIDVLQNDDSDATITRLLSNPRNGTASIVDRKIVYQPNAGFSGSDSFDYEVKDPNGNIDSATVTINITAPINSAPSAVDDSTRTNQGEAVTLSSLNNDSDPDDDNLTITNVTTPENGSAVISGDQIIYTPSPDFVGTDTFNYTISDGNGGSATATETIIVEAIANQSPIANNDTAATGCSTITINVLDNDSDPEGDTINLVSVTGASLGTATVAGNSIIYKPSNTCDKGNTGVDTLSYTINDGNGNTASANISVDVQGGEGNTKAEPDDVVTTDGQPVTINVLLNDAGIGLTITAVDNPTNGTTTISGNSIIYTPNPGFTGTESFWYDIIDANGYKDAAMVLVYVDPACPTGTKCN